MGTDRKTSRKRWYIVLGVAGALAIGGGIWALVAGLSSSGNREGASCTGTCGRRSTATYGSTIYVYNNGPYALRVTDEQNGVPAQIIPSCATDTYWPKDPTVTWTKPTFGYWPTGDELTNKFTTYPKADISTCKIAFTGKVKGRTTDVDLLIETCVPGRQDLDPGPGLPKGAFGCIGFGGGGVEGFELKTDHIKARSSALGVHAIWSDTQTIADNYGGKTEGWYLGVDKYRSLTVDVAADPHARLDPDNVYVYTLTNFRWPWNMCESSVGRAYGCR
ncbi:MAG: hypothetical protein WCH93_04745 [Actinomycetota bacterium]